MKKWMMASSVMLALGCVVATTWACPGDEAAKKDQSTKQTAQQASSPYAGIKATVVSGTTFDGRSDEKGGCGKDCTKPCCKKSGATAKSPCSGKSAVTASAKSPCSGKSAVTASAKSPCSGKSAVTASAKSPCCGKCDKGATASADGGCPIAKKVSALLASMPSMKYRVGDEVTGCSKSAAAIAKKTGKKMQFVVGETVVSDEGEALVQLTALLEKEAGTLRSMQFVADGKCGRCPMTAKSNAKKSGTTVAYRVGGVDFASKDDANKAIAKIDEALAALTMEYKVDGKTYGCNKTAGAKCKKSGAKMTYVVGEDETPCQVTAKRMLAEAKFRKIVETAVATSFSL